MSAAACAAGCTLVWSMRYGSLRSCSHVHAFRMLYVSCSVQTEYSSLDAPLRLSDIPLPTYTQSQRIDLLYDVLFDDGYLGAYHTMKAREEGQSGPVKADEIETVLCKYAGVRVASNISMS